jgi:hypothetical protein
VSEKQKISENNEVRTNNEAEKKEKSQKYNKMSEISGINAELSRRCRSLNRKIINLKQMAELKRNRKESKIK